MPRSASAKRGMHIVVKHPVQATQWTLTIVNHCRTPCLSAINARRPLQDLTVCRCVRHQDILARLLQQQLSATYVTGSLQLAASASITAPGPGAASAPSSGMSVF